MIYPTAYPTAYPRKQCGFTLVEMLVALTLFAMLAAIGVGLLRGSVDTHIAVQQRLVAMGSVNRLRSILAYDLGQSVARVTRAAGGQAVPAFLGANDHFVLVRTGGDTLEVLAHPLVQRIAYRFEDGALWRATQPMLDGVVMGDGDVVTDGLTLIAISYRGERGEWESTWDSAAHEDRLPRAVRIMFTYTGRQSLVMLFLTGPQNRPRSSRSQRALENAPARGSA